MTSQAPEQNLLYPLNEFYDQMGLPLPAAIQVKDRDVPEPYRTLLVHTRDMTPTLAGFYDCAIQLRVLRHTVRHDIFSRQIVLFLEDDHRPVVFGAIKIYLERFPVDARRLIQEMKEPLGTILQTQGIAHTSRPEAYIQVRADATINRELELTGSHLLYGRSNVLWNNSWEPLAKVVEILPPSHV